MMLTVHTGMFLAALSLMLVHELDAMRCHEWRIFPILEKLDDTLAMRWFIWLHVPILAAVFWYSAAVFQFGGNAFSVGFCLFCVLHGLVHWLYERHPKCEFRNFQSRAIIWSCAAAGLAGLIFSPVLG